MAKITIDATDASSGSRSEYFLPGLVLFEVDVEPEVKKAQSGNQGLVWSVRCVAAQPGREENIGRKMSRWTMLSGKGAGFTIDYLRAMGFTKAAAGNIVTLDTEKTIGRVFGASVQDDEKALDRNNNPVQRSEITQVFTAAEYETRIAALKKAGVKTLPPVARNGAAEDEVEEDDVPTPDVADDDDEL